MAPARSAGRGRPVLTGRALGLGVLVVVLVVVLASPVHRYLASRSAIGTAAAQLADDQRQLAALRRSKALYGDPGYLQRQARIRLQYAMPGDTVYAVVGKGARTGIEKTRTAAPSTTVTGPSWNDRLMSSVRAAGR